MWVIGCVSVQTDQQANILINIDTQKERRQMQSSLLSIQTIKIIFILATSLYTFSYFRRRGSSGVSEARQRKIREGLKGVLVGKEGWVDGERVYGLFEHGGREEERGDRKGGEEGEQIGGKQREQFSGGDQGRDKPADEPSTKQQSALQSEIDTIMRQHLLSLMSAPHPHLDSYLVQHDPSLPHILPPAPPKITHSLHANIPIQNSIVQVQVSTQEEGEQIFRPIVKQIRMDEERQDQRGEFVWDAKCGYMMGNEQVLRRRGRLEDKAIVEEKTKKRIRKYRLKGRKVIDKEKMKKKLDSTQLDNKQKDKTDQSSVPPSLLLPQNLIPNGLKLHPLTKITKTQISYQFAKPN